MTSQERVIQTPKVCHKQPILGEKKTCGLSRPLSKSGSVRQQGHALENVNDENTSKLAHSCPGVFMLKTGSKGCDSTSDSDCWPNRHRLVGLVWAQTWHGSSWWWVDCGSTDHPGKIHNYTDVTMVAMEVMVYTCNSEVQTLTEACQARAGMASRQICSCNLWSQLIPRAWQRGG